MYIHFRNIFSESSSTVVRTHFGVMAHRELISPACLSPTEISLSLCQILQRTRTSPLAGKRLSATALNSIIANQEHMVRLIGAATPLSAAANSGPVPHTLSEASLQIRAAEVYCRSLQSGPAMGGPGPGWLPREWGIMSWRQELVQSSLSD